MFVTNCRRNLLKAVQSPMNEPIYELIKDKARHEMIRKRKTEKNHGRKVVTRSKED